MAIIADRLKEAMELRNLKQADLVEKTGISKGALSSYLSGRYSPKQNNIYLLAKALSVNEAWLMGANIPMDRNKGNDYLNNITIDTIAFEVTGRSLQYSPKIYDAICNHFDELPVTENNLTYTRGAVSVRGLADFIRNPDISFSEKAYMINKLIEMVLYDTKKEQLILYYNLDKNSVINLQEQLQKIVHNLNDSGIKKVIDYATDLANMPIYTEIPHEANDGLLLDAAHERTDIEVTDEMREHDDDIMNDENF